MGEEPASGAARGGEHCHASGGYRVLVGGGFCMTPGPNPTDRWREGLVVSRAVGWIRQETNQYKDIPVEKAKYLDPKVRAILGYSSSGKIN